MAKKTGNKKNFHLMSFAVKKVKKVGLLRSGYAAGLPGGCFAVSASSAILQSRASRTQWPNGPAMPTLRLALLEDNQAPRGRQSTDGGAPIMNDD